MNNETQKLEMNDEELVQVSGGEFIDSDDYEENETYEKAHKYAPKED